MSTICRVLETTAEQFTHVDGKHGIGYTVHYRNGSERFISANVVALIQEKQANA